jgi:hypothetical protein
MNKESEKLSVVKVKAGESASTKLQAMLKKRNLYFRHLPVSVRYLMETIWIPLRHCS